LIITGKLKFGQVSSEEYSDEMVTRGAKFAWFFTYMSIGVDAY
jgi:hypothetical protein